MPRDKIPRHTVHSESSALLLPNREWIGCFETDEPMLRQRCGLARLVLNVENAPSGASCQEAMAGSAACDFVG